MLWISFAGGHAKYTYLTVNEKREIHIHIIFWREHKRSARFRTYPQIVGREKL